MGTQQESNAEYRLQPRRAVRLHRRRRDREHATESVRLRPEKLVFEVRGLPTDDYKGTKVGNIFVGTEGIVACPNYSGGIAFDKAGLQIAKFNDGKDQYHFDNFLKAVRSRKVEDLNCDIHEGHLSASLCHLANISYRLGTAKPIGKAEAVSDNKTVNEFAARMVEHLKANKVDPTSTVGKFGPVLSINPKTEQFTNQDKELTEQGQCDAQPRVPQRIRAERHRVGCLWANGPVCAAVRLSDY